MPEITRFQGIIIKMFFRNEHNPPHIHAIYGEHNALIEISTLNMIEGDLSNKTLKLVQKWVKLNQVELMEMWNNKKNIKLPPL